MLVQITSKPISPEQIIKTAKTASSGCVVTYVGLIRDNARDKKVFEVEYQDPRGEAESKLRQIASEALEKWPLNEIAIERLFIAFSIEKKALPHPSTSLTVLKQ